MPRVKHNEFLSVIFHNVIRRSDAGSVRSLQSSLSSDPSVGNIMAGFNNISSFVRGSMVISYLHYRILGWDDVIFNL